MQQTVVDSRLTTADEKIALLESLSPEFWDSSSWLKNTYRCSFVY